MWQVKEPNFRASASPQPGKTTLRTPLRELNLQSCVSTNSGKTPPLCLSSTPTQCELPLQKGQNSSSSLNFVSTKRTDSPSEQFISPSKWLEAGQHESDKDLPHQVPKPNSAPRTSEEAVFPGDNCLVKTMVLTSSPVSQQQVITLGTPLDVIAATNSFSLDEPLRSEDQMRGGAALCPEDSFSKVVATLSEDPPCCLLEFLPNPCSEQQIHGSQENLRDSRTEPVPESPVLPDLMLQLSLSTSLETDFPSNHVDPGEEIGEHIAIEEREMGFSALSEQVELEDKALVSAMEDILSTCLTQNPVEIKSEEVPDTAVEDAGRILVSDTGPWMSPLNWLGKGVNTSVMLENLCQSLSLPSVLQDTVISASPFTTCSVGTWFTPPAVQEKSTNTTQTDEGNKDKAPSETEHLMRGHPPDLTALSRHDLEENLLSSLIILEVLSRQLRDWKSQLAGAHQGAQDSSTQTNSSSSEITKAPQQLQNCQEIGRMLQQARNFMQSWVLVSKEVINLLHLSLVHLEDDKATVSQKSQHAKALVSCCFDVLKKSRAKVQSLIAEREEAMHKEEMALRGKDAAETVLEAFCAHASQRISQLEQNLVAMREFRALLTETQNQLVGLHAEQEELAQQTDSLTSTLQQDWVSMQLDYITWTALLSRSRQVTEKLAAKSREALQERNAAIEEKHKVSRELEQVSTNLENCKGQLEQLELKNSHLTTDLQAQLQILASMESQLKELQDQHAHCAQDLAMKDDMLCRLTQSSEEHAAQWQREEMALKTMQAELQQQQAVLSNEVQDLKETLEFADHENQVAHLELGQVECQLKATLEVLRERSLQCEDLRDTVENLKAKLASTVAENQEQDLERKRQYSHELGVLTEQLQSLTLFLQENVKEKAEPEPPPVNTASAFAWEHPLPNNSAFLGSVLTATADEEPKSAPTHLIGSEKSAFTRVTSMAFLQPTENPDMEKSLAEMQTMTLELQNLCSLLQESKEEAVRTLQQKICNLQDRLQAQEEQHQEAQKAKEADIEKLNQALCLRYKNEKELQEVIQQQNEKILEQIDKSGELIRLREEVAQLTRSLWRAETETKVLQETLAAQQDPDCQPMATNWIQEKVWLTQEVNKLRVMFLEMKEEKAKLRDKFQSHRNILEENLRLSDKELKKLDNIVQHIYETLQSIPEVVRGCKELQELLEFLS
ncbi:PREDICTED: sperm-associated antigen 5 [Elephantulus edwardii]|uniref:sperm-associated antigen 5 n=1 Tax=Elephantulus edwardii TaxID=28737 RepID=UPI0003F0B6FE|nr:PREDICTED: sperm-associated antigen 5 [Elephantulus edwardii]